MDWQGNVKRRVGMGRRVRRQKTKYFGIRISKLKIVIQDPKVSSAWCLVFIAVCCQLPAASLIFALSLGTKLSGGAGRASPTKHLWTKARAQAAAMVRRRRTRSSIGGWVLNHLARPPPLRGLTVNMWAVAGLASSMGMRFEA